MALLRGATCCTFCDFTAPDGRGDLLRKHLQKSHTQEATVGKDNWQTIAGAIAGRATDASGFAPGICWTCARYLKPGTAAELLKHTCTKRVSMEADEEAAPAVAYIPSPPLDDWAKVAELIDQADLLNDQKSKVKFFADMADKTAEPWTNFVRMILTLGIAAPAPAPVVAPAPVAAAAAVRVPVVSRAQRVPGPVIAGSIQAPVNQKSGFKILPIPGLGR
jgi:hypothetical protein